MAALASHPRFLALSLIGFDEPLNRAVGCICGRGGHPMPVKSEKTLKQTVWAKASGRSERVLKRFDDFAFRQLGLEWLLGDRRAAIVLQPVFSKRSGERFVTLEIDRLNQE